MNEDPQSQPSEDVYNKAQRARGAADTDVKKVTDMPEIDGGETWGNASGHSGTRRGWLATAVILAGFVLGGIGITFGPRVLLWIGIGVIIVAGVAGLSAHAWTDYHRGAGSAAQE